MDVGGDKLFNGRISVITICINRISVRQRINDKVVRQMTGYKSDDDTISCINTKMMTNIDE